MDAAQGILLFVLVILTILVITLGIQVFFILRELRQTVIKANKVLDDAGSITSSVSGPIATISNLAAGVKTGSLIAGLLKKKSPGAGSSSAKEQDNE